MLIIYFICLFLVSFNIQAIPQGRRRPFQSIENYEVQPVPRRNKLYESVGDSDESKYKPLVDLQDHIQSLKEKKSQIEVAFFNDLKWMNSIKTQDYYRDLAHDAAEKKREAGLAEIKKELYQGVKLSFPWNEPTRNIIAKYNDVLKEFKF